MKLKLIIIMGIIAITYFYVKDIKMEQSKTKEEIMEKVFYGKNR